MTYISCAYSKLKGSFAREVMYWKLWLMLDAESAAIMRIVFNRINIMWVKLMHTALQPSALQNTVYIKKAPHYPVTMETQLINSAWPEVRRGANSHAVPLFVAFIAITKNKHYGVYPRRSNFWIFTFSWNLVWMPCQANSSKFLDPYQQ